MIKKILFIFIGIVVVSILLGGGLFFWSPNIKIVSEMVVPKMPEVIKKVPPIDMRILVKDNNALRELLQKIGIKESMKLLLDQSGGGATYDCHQEAHQIGRIGYSVEKEKAFQNCSADCHSGCYHGAMESFLNEKGVEHLASDITAVCSKFQTSFSNFECLHGVGHGILAYVDYDLPEALKECRKLSDSFSQTSCYGGLFMENILTGQGLGASDKPEHETKWVNRTDPYFPCDKIDKDPAIQYQCYQMQTSWMLILTGYNFDTVVKQCLQAPDNMQFVCFKSFGRDAAGFALRDPKKTLDICAKVPQEGGYYTECLDGAVNVIIDFWGPGLKNQASELCALTSGNHKQDCYGMIANRLPGLFSEKADREKVCATFEPAYQNLCQ